MKETDPLTFLKTVYMNTDLPLSVRMRAAMATLPFTHPRLAVVAQISESDFAAVLDRRLDNLKRIEESKANVTAKVIEASAAPVDARLPSRTSDKRFRRI